MKKISYSLVFNRKKKLNKKGMALVQVEAYLNRRKMYFSTRVYLKPDQWDVKRRMVKNHPNSDALNRMLYDFIADIEQKELGLWQQRRSISLDSLKDSIEKPENNGNSFLTFFKEEVNNSSLKESTRQNHLSTLELLQEYMKYLVGIGDLALGNIRNQLCNIKKFLVYFNTLESICEITEEQIAEYFKLLQEEEIKAETVNRQIFDIHRFFVYLNAKGHIKRIIFDPNYFIQKVFPYHHDRSVQEDEYMEILQKLKFFPEVQRLIFLNLWATGLRISEVCTLKGGAYYWDGEDAWIKVYQIKMKAEKMIPISLVLYQIMKIYIKKHHIKPTDFLFKSKDGGAYRTGTFVKGFKANCKKYGIHISGETFKTHDYRHTLASSFYDEGVSIQTIRDYLGHNNENMTKQYIDYMPKRIEQANKEYFNQAENLLATGIIPKKRGEKTGK